MSTPHNEAKIGEIAKTVIMPGDPLRAKYIAENFLNDYKLVNSVRGMYAYTGTYKGKEITVMAHGMGMPSIGIYSYELYKVYGVENIIRIGSCGAYLPELKLFDIVLSEKVFSESNFALTLNNEDCHIVEADYTLNNIIKETANETNINIHIGNTVCTDCFDVYMTDVNQFLARVPEGFNPASAEMEAFALFYVAKMLNKKASCLMSVVDSKYIKDIATPEERQTGLNNMIKLALDSSLKM
ncbi:MAG: purine-nucleoside phosphorylase [Clostridia bacterium]|nr:purine-nucleoside phosphorylase [Clostridia bacterium]